jgi:4-amino-4-deoxy-L-arabinose transferase-like glycosyltransferase
MKFEKHHYYYLFVGFLFLGIVSVNLFSDGMFLDGLLYADISRNMAEGLGTFWKPHLSYGIFNEFYEHPPLALGLQSLWFKVFGDSIFVERFYSLSTFIIVGYLIVLIWGKFTGDKKHGWIPLLLWIIINNVAWAAANNMLENTMSIFVCLSLLFYLNSIENKRFLWIVLSGVSLSLGLLTKGFFCLYIWSVPFFMWVFMRQRTFLQMIKDSVLIVLCTLIPIVLLYLFIPAAQNNMLQYFNMQVIGSIQNVKTVDTRFAIIGKFFENIVVPLFIGIIVIVVARLKNVPRHLLKENSKIALMFLAIVLSGILPIMISMKQRSFYILTVYPLFAIGLAYYLYPILKLTINKMAIESKGFKIFKGITIGVFMISIGLSIGQINRVGRDKAMIYDSKAVITIVGRDNTINICPNMYSIWSLHGYFSRYGNVSLESNQNIICQYYLTLDDCNNEVLENNYDLLPIGTKNYKLYKLKENK